MGKWMDAKSAFMASWYSGWDDWGESAWGGKGGSAWGGGSGWGDGGKESWKGAGGKSGKGKGKEKGKGAGESGEQWYEGTIRHYAKQKGFGFITGSEYGEDVYVHTNVVEKCGGYDGSRVQFKIHMSASGKA